MGPIKNAFIKGMNIILPKLENPPRESWSKQLTKGTPEEAMISSTPDIELVDMEKEFLRVCSRQATKGSSDDAMPPFTSDIEPVEMEAEPPCACYDLGIECLEVAYLNTPSFESLQTKESGLDYIRYSVSLLEQMSTCEKCAEETTAQEFLFLFCRAILQQCRAFYDMVAQTRDDEDQQPLLLPGHMWVTDRVSAVFVLGMLTEGQMKRFHTCVGRIIETLRDHPVFDEDAWMLMEAQAYRLVVDSAMC
ncbi:uncharacterized protein ACLA_035770 [Aspergillus clavatus NRRL 1]|uniref:C6 transcription factor n=1 Tax=Aspergillus clavatus (strain ATCC 1007 / CBS 513.65 / DSM 816 / NCTC 3887 / NRRL 1 / QM 1276 / 107) TaxID=344612 RepID=A1CJQ0_ASPCL|nr:uncharacterized protein ACLA_035770 [Aspergillus clavatus NRRL 1]EAW09374.1 conserved hypothetical protein [Aspergillus clavatus NRRL 1]